MAPSAAKLKEELIEGTREVYRAEPDGTSVNKVRRHVEEKLGLEDGFFTSDTWKQKSKAIIKEQVVSTIIQIIPSLCRFSDLPRSFDAIRTNYLTKTHPNPNTNPTQKLALSDSHPKSNPHSPSDERKHRGPRKRKKSRTLTKLPRKRPAPKSRSSCHAARRK